MLHGSDAANGKRRKERKRKKRRKNSECDYKCKHKLVSAENMLFVEG